MSLAKRAVVLAAVTLAACKLGGPSADPNAYVDFPADGGDDAGADATVDDGGGGEIDATTGDDAPDGEADGGEGQDSGDGGDDAGEAGAARRDGGSCQATSLTCDPVHDTGCVNAAQQCDVDTSKSTPTGVCVFNSPADGGACASSIFTESCPPHFTCAGGTCRQPCFCDSDCPAAQCCSDRSGPGAFALCGACP